jgi:hypothetical protein
MTVTRAGTKEETGVAEDAKPRASVTARAYGTAIQGNFGGAVGFARSSGPDRVEPEELRGQIRAAAEYFSTLGIVWVRNRGLFLCVNSEASGCS